VSEREEQKKKVRMRKERENPHPPRIVDNSKAINKKTTEVDQFDN
jgi:hypothetical protein